MIVDGVSADEQLIRDGAAEWYDRFGPEDPELATRLEAAEREAQAESRGLWSACKAGVATVTAPRLLVPRRPSATTSTTAVKAEAPGGGDCLPAYPDECFPVGGADLDCPHVGHEVHVDRYHGDPHGFDRDRDGRGCESYA